jgi:hypothetical protein
MARNMNERYACTVDFGDSPVLCVNRLLAARKRPSLSFSSLPRLLWCAE